MADDQKGPEPAIRLVGLRRVYGDRAALADLSLETPVGASLVVLGPNGAGKTTLLRILATLLRPTDGEVSVLGCALPDQAWKLRGRIGYLGHTPLLYRDLSGRENLRFHAKLHGITGERAEARIEELLATVKLSHRGDERIHEFSAGMAQRIAICRCVLHEPELLLLDEPDSNLDIPGREIAKSLIGRGGGHTRVVVTHDPERFLPEADQVLRLGIDEAAAVS